MPADYWTRRGLRRALLSVPNLLAHARGGMRMFVAKKAVYDTLVAKYSVITSIFKDMTGGDVHTTERAIELPLVESLIRAEPKGTRTLEVGSGDSPFLLTMAEQGYEMMGTDVHPYPFRNQLLSFARSDALTLPFRDGSFDVVFAISTIEHIGLGYYGDSSSGEGDSKVVGEFARVLRPGGKCIVTVPMGCEGIPGFERVYDAVSINRLFSNFLVLKEYYWMYEHGKWGRVPKERAKTGPPLREGGSLPGGVIVIQAAKPLTDS